MKTRLILTSIFLIAVCVAWLVPFIGILVMGSHVVQEPNAFILYGELLMFILLVGFGISNLIVGLKE